MACVDGHSGGDTGVADISDSDLKELRHRPFKKGEAATHAKRLYDEMPW